MTESSSREIVEAYRRYCRPLLVELLGAMKLDVVYERAEGNRLWYRNNGQLTEVLDFAGGYGSTLFGHNHPGLVAEAQRMLTEQVPFAVQGSCRQGAARLAAKLSARMGDDYVTFFTNSGAEAVEAAIKHAHLEQGRSLYWAVSGAFHGKTLGAIQLTNAYREPYKKWGPEVRFLDPGDMHDWERAKSESGAHVAAVFVEPIQGEGGIRPLPGPFVEWLNQIREELGVPIIVDEIQTGMGRTGSFLRSSEIGLRPDYICLGKSLGGGLAKIGALMIRRERLVEEFAITQTSTFAEDDYSCGIALKALDYLESDELARRCAEKGQLLLSALKELQASYPEQIADVRGAGLMIGIELADHSRSRSNVVKMLSQGGYLAWAAAAYLLHVHGIRIAPTLNQSSTLRVQPSAYISAADIQRFVDAMRMLCEAMKLADAGHLTGYQVGLRSRQIRDWRPRQSSRLEEPRTQQRVAFIGHFLTPRGMALCDPSLSLLSEQMLDEYLTRTLVIARPTLVESLNVESASGSTAHITFIGLPITTQQIISRRQSTHRHSIPDLIESAVVLARDIGCRAVGLGGYTSSVTGNCLRIRTNNIALTSGNALTLGMAIEALKKTASENGMELSGAQIAVVGVPGNIASTAALMLAPYASELILVQRTSIAGRTDPLVEEIATINPGVRVEVTDDLHSLRRACVILSASTSGGGIIQPCHLSMERVIICDIAAPPDVSHEVLHERPNAIVLSGGIVRLTNNEDFYIPGIPLKPGRVFACMAETLLMGLEDIREHQSYGKITRDQVEQMMSLATRHGFAVDAVQRHAAQPDPSVAF